MSPYLNICRSFLLPTAMTGVAEAWQCLRKAVQAVRLSLLVTEYTSRMTLAQPAHLAGSLAAPTQEVTLPSW